MFSVFSFFLKTTGLFPLKFVFLKCSVRFISLSDLITTFDTNEQEMLREILRNSEREPCSRSAE